jgi:hypothetical protein
MTSVTRFDEIVFVDDFFRSSANTLQSHPSNRRFFFRALGIPAARLGIPCREIAARSDGGTLDIAAMMNELSLPQDSNGWAKSGLADLQHLARANLLPRFGPTILVIGWGMPPSLMRLIDEGGASFIDFEVAPIRFGPHLAFCARTNDRQIEQALESWRIDEEAFWNDATILKGCFARRGSPNIFNGSLSVGLFCGQTHIDLALVQDGRIMQPIDLVEPIQRLATEVDVLLIKPHPYEEDVSHLKQLATHIPNATWTDANIYALLCADNLEFVCGLSSGALQEANYFMKRSVPLIGPDRNNPAKIPPACSPWMPIRSEFLSLGGMATLCSGPGQVTAPDAPVAEDVLNRAFGLRWGFDTNNPGLNALPELTLGRKYEIRAGQAATTWLSFGWGPPEGTGVWTVGERACLVIPMPAVALADPATVSIRLEGNVFVGSPSRIPRVRARLNERELNIRVEEEGGQGVRIELSASAFSIKDARVLLIEIDITEPQRPLDWGIGDDTRRLGFHLRLLSVHADGVALGHDATVAQRASPLPRRREKPAATGLAAIVAALCMVVAALLYAGNGGSAELRLQAFRWSEIKHTVATEIGILRDDIHAMFKPHHV